MAIRILSDQNVTSNVIAIQAFRLGTDSLWKLRGNAASTELAFEYSTSSSLSDANIKVIFTPSGAVGIGDNVTPSQKLHVAGNIYSINSGTDGGQIRLANSGGGSNWYWAARTTGLNLGELGVADGNIFIANGGNVGIGTIEPDGKVHIFKGSNGATTVGTASDELILENDTDCGLTIRSAADGTGVVSFASPTDHNVGQLYYNHDDDSMVIRTNDAIRTIIGSSGIMYIMGATASTNNSLQLQYNSTAGTAEIYSKSTGGNTTFEFYTSSSGTTTQKFNIGSSGDVKITTNGKFLQGVRNTGGSVIDMIGFGAGTDRLQIKGGTSGGSESIAFFDTAGQMATFYNSNFGIGTTSPSAKLDISHATTPLMTRNSSGLAMFNEISGGYSYLYLYQIGGGARVVISTNGNSYFNGGNLGIGTTSPDQTGYGYKTLTIMGGTTAGYAGVLELLAPSTNANGQNLGIISFGSGGTRNAMIGAVRQSGNNNGKLQFWTAAGANGIENRMTIDADGQVGIGIDSPQTTLQVNGAASALNAHFGQGQNNSSGVFGGISLGYSESANASYRKVGIVAKAIGDGAARQELHFLVNSNADSNSAGIADTKMMISTSGNVGIGTTAPGAKLHVDGKTILANTEHSDYATGSINTTGVVVATVPSSTNGQSVMITFEATGGTGSVYSVIYSCYNGGGNWYYTKNVLIFGGNIEVAETNGSGSSTLSFSFRATSGSAAYTPRVVMKGSPYGLVSFI